jgi:hypothetical protein
MHELALDAARDFEATTIAACASSQRHCRAACASCLLRTCYFKVFTICTRNINIDIKFQTSRLNPSISRARMTLEQAEK